MASTRQKRLSDDARILALFGDPKESYSLTELLRLTGTPRRSLEELLKCHNVETRSDGRFDWQEVAFIAVMRWGVRRITGVLLRHKRDVPALNQLVGVRVQLPVYQIRALQEEAARKSADTKAEWGVSDVLTVVLSEWRIPAAGVDHPDHWPLPSPAG